jgi:hypothetical protein
MLASTLKGVVGDTIDATVILLEAGDIRGPMLFEAIGDGVLSVPDDWYPEDGGVKRCELLMETIEVSRRGGLVPRVRVAKGIEKVVTCLPCTYACLPRRYLSTRSMPSRGFPR